MKISFDFKSLYSDWSAPRSSQQTIKENNPFISNIVQTSISFTKNVPAIPFGKIYQKLKSFSQSLKTKIDINKTFLVVNYYFKSALIEEQNVSNEFIQNQIIEFEGVQVVIESYASEFQIALINKNLENIKKILTKEPSLVNQLNYDGVPPLAVAIFLEDLEIMSLLIQNGADCHYVDAQNENLIYKIAAKKNKEMLNLLLKSGVSIDEAMGKSPPALITACNNQERDIMEFLIQAGADVNIVDHEGNTPLLKAIENNDLDAVKILLDRSADIDQINLKTGINPIYSALQNKGDIAVYLVERGAYLNYIYSEGFTLLEVINSLNTHSFRELEDLRQIFYRKGLYRTLTDNIFHRKMLAHVWGIGGGLGFKVNGGLVMYEMFLPNNGLQKLRENFLECLPCLKEKFPCFFNALVEEKLILANKQSILNYNMNETTAETIIKNSQIFPQILTNSWDEKHVTCIVIYKNQLVKVNRGAGNGFFGLEYFRMDKVLTPEIIDKIRDISSRSFFYDELDQLLNLQFEKVQEFSPQEVGNCGWASPKLAEFAVLELLKNETKYASDSAEDVIKQIYKAFTSFAREQELEKYLQRLQRYPGELDWQLLFGIREKINVKLSYDKLTSTQRENFERALLHFDTYLPRFLSVNAENKDSIIYYLMAAKDKEKIVEALKLGLDCFEFIENYENTGAQLDNDLYLFLIEQNLIINFENYDNEQLEIYNKLIDYRKSFIEKAA